MNTVEEFQQRLMTQATLAFPGRKMVLGEGVLGGKICMIGEAPGAEEEKQGHPFVGKAGKNLTEFLNAVGLNRDDLYITNVVKIRPFRLSPKTGKPINRPPDTQEKGFFTPFLLEELDIVNAEYIVTLGNVPLKAVMQKEAITIGEVHGRLLISPSGKKVFPLYHPAAVIYNQKLSAVYGEDLQKLKQLL
ncbi:MAG: uracil-DNA glycosylase [Epulopiscium sp.]|nr:uracil-DNA glycosylase [Candidatus Epulonipiscium sp.]